MTSYVRSRVRLSVAAILCVTFVAACDGDSEPAAETASPRQASAARDGGGAAPPLPPDAGVRTGHGADPALVEVPQADATPPIGTIALVLPGGRHCNVR